MQPAPSYSSPPASPASAPDPTSASSTLRQTQTATAAVTQSNATSTSATSSPSPNPANGAPSATSSSTTQNDTANLLAPVRVKFDNLPEWLRKDWDLKLLALLALVWGIKTYNEQIRGNKLNEMEACRNHPNPALQNTSLCNEMRKAHDFDELVRRSIERVPDIVYYPLLWRDIFGAFFPVLLVILAVWRSRRKTDSFCLEHDQDTQRPIMRPTAATFERSLYATESLEAIDCYENAPLDHFLDVHRWSERKQMCKIFRTLFKLFGRFHHEFQVISNPCPHFVRLYRSAMFQTRDTWQGEPVAFTVPRHYIPHEDGSWELFMAQGSGARYFDESGTMYWDCQQGQRMVPDQHFSYPSAPYKHTSLVLTVEKRLSLTKVSAWLGGLGILGASAWSLGYSTSTEFLSWITIFGAATLFGGCMGILYLQLHFIKNRYTDRFRLAQMRARIFFQRLH